MGKGDTGKSRDDDCNGFAYLPAPAAKKSREGHPKIDDSHDGECARSGSYRRGGEFDECFQVPSSIRPPFCLFRVAFLLIISDYRFSNLPRSPFLDFFHAAHFHAVNSAPVSSSGVYGSQPFFRYRSKSKEFLCKRFQLRLSTI